MGKKLILALVVVLVLALGFLVACGGPTPEGEQPTSTPVEEEPTSPPEEEEATSPPEEEPTSPPEEEEPTEAPVSFDGEALLQERCTRCHTLDRVKQAEQSREEWEQSIDDMIRRGADLNEEERSFLIDYLTETYGP